MSNLISARELHDRLNDPDLVVVDARFYLGKPEKGKAEYEEGHIPGAVYLDLEDDLSAPVSEHGGRHPLPDVDAFASTLERAGVSNTSKVIAYDSAAGAIAGRLWWMLKYLGHDEVRVLDGGYRAWTGAGYPVSAEVPVPEKGSFTPKPRSEMVAEVEDVKRALENSRALLIDARSAERYRGEREPIDKKPGHIPGAKNYPLTENLEGGKFKPATSLKERFKGVEEADEVIVYCGSGVSAAHNLIALSEAGYRGAKLYVGSWSDWISYDDSTIAIGDEP